MNGSKLFCEPVKSPHDLQVEKQRGGRRQNCFICCERLKAERNNVRVTIRTSKETEIDLTSLKSHLIE